MIIRLYCLRFRFVNFYFFFLHSIILNPLFIFMFTVVGLSVCVCVCMSHSNTRTESAPFLFTDTICGLTERRCKQSNVKHTYSFTWQRSHATSNGNRINQLAAIWCAHTSQNALRMSIARKQVALCVLGCVIIYRLHVPLFQNECGLRAMPMNRWVQSATHLISPSTYFRVPWNASKVTAIFTFPSNVWHWPCGQLTLNDSTWFSNIDIRQLIPSIDNLRVRCLPIPLVVSKWSTHCAR